MNKIITTRESEIAVEIGTIKRQTAGTLLRAAMEIGRLLCEAKELVPYGEWGNWLTEKVDYSQTTAANLMRLYREYSEKEQLSFLEDTNMEIFGNLTPSQALALLPLPVEERREYVESHDMDATSVRDIEKEIEARKEAEKKAEEYRSEKTKLEEAADKMQATIDALREELAEKPEQIAITETEEYKSGIRKAAADAKKKAEEAASKELAKKEAAFAEEKKNILSEAERKLAEAKQDGDTAALKAEKEALEKKLRQAASAGVQQFSVHLELFQREYSEMTRLLGEIEDAEVAEKLKKGLGNLLKSMEI